MDRLNNNKITPSGERWLSVEDISQLLNISCQAVRKACKSNRYKVRLVGGNGGQQYNILLSSLPVDAQLKYYEDSGILKTNTQAAEVQNNKGRDLAQKQWEIALARFDFIKFYVESSERSTNKVKAKQDFIEAYNHGAIPDLLKILGQTSYKTAERWKKTLKESNFDPVSLAPGYTYVKPRSVTAEQADILIREFLNPNQPPKREAIRLAKNIMRIKGVEDNLSECTYERFLDDWIEKNYDLYCIAREGEKSLNDNVIFSISRDLDKIEVGDIIFADGKTLDFFMQNPFTGKPKRMTLIMFFDMKSSMPLGFDIMPSENVMTIASALRRTILLLGFIPRIIYIDNGKAFRSKYFQGIDDFKTTGIQGLFERLNINVIFAKKYHGQSKSQERFHRTMSEYERLLPSYSGMSAMNKPARFGRNEIFHRTLYDRMTEGTLPTVRQVYQSLINWFMVYADRAHQDGFYKGYTPNEIFSKSIDRVRAASDYPSRVIAKDELNYLMLEEETRDIRKNGIELFSKPYWAEELYGRHHKAIIKYDFLDDSEVLVYDTNGKFICKAIRSDLINPAARLLGTEEDVKKLEEKLKMQGRLKKSTMANARELYDEEYINLRSSLLSLHKNGGEIIPLAEKQIQSKQLPSKREKTGTDDLDLSQFIDESRSEANVIHTFQFEKDEFDGKE